MVGGSGPVVKQPAWSRHAPKDVAEHEVADGVAAGDESAGPADDAGEERPYGADIDGYPLRHGDGHAPEAARVHARVQV